MDGEQKEGKKEKNWLVLTKLGENGRKQEH